MGTTQLGKMSHGRKKDHGKKLRKRICGKTETDGELGCQTTHQKWKETS
jgi:hypothetical protein